MTPDPDRGRPDAPLEPEDWTPWTEVANREELRRRLEVLAKAPRLPSDQYDFVLFFFRASDPVLYPLAAMTLGRNLRFDPELARWLEGYAAARGMTLSAPVRLDGVRSHRRVLIALAQARADHPDPSLGWALDEEGGERRLVPAGADTEGGVPWPLSPEIPRDRPADLAAYLRALDILTAGACGEDTGHQTRVLEELAGDPGILVDGSGAERWARLLDSVLARSRDPEGEEWGRELWNRVVRALRLRLEAPESVGLGARLGFRRALAGLERGMGRPGWRALPEELEESADAVRRRLADRLRLVRDPALWWSFDETERACTTFDLLQGALAWRFPPGELHRLLDAFGCPVSGRAPGRVLLAVARREEVPAAELLDAASIHAMDDPELLLELLPRDRPGEPGAALADALEHRIRTALATDAAFDLPVYLARVEVCRPHTGFLQLLRGVTANREYVDARGDVVPLDRWLEGTEAEARAARAGDTSSLQGPPPVPGPLSSLRTGVRRLLIDLEGEDDPFHALTRLADLLEGGGGSGVADAGNGAVPRPDRRGLPLILERLSRPDVPGARGAGDLAADLGDGARSLRRWAEALIPPHLHEIEVARDSAAEIRSRLAALEAGLNQRLPHPEAVLLEGVLGGIEAGLAEWVAALEAMDRVHHEEASGWDSILGAASEAGRPAFRSHLLPVAWRTLARGVQAGSARGVELVEWAVRRGEELSPGDREVWLEAVAGHWVTALYDAMDSGLETRLARLVRKPGARALALLPGTDEALVRARKWLFDCYRVADAAVVTRALNVRRGKGPLVTLPRDALSSFLHYSPVWLALLVGAILMLDFGDAWTSMAEIGDTRGILITFVVGLLGAFGYVAAELHSRVRDAPEERAWLNRVRRLLRAGVFVVFALVYTVLVVSVLWWLLSGTDEVVHGAGAVLHVVVWSGFALFVGVFFGLMAKST